MDRILSYFIAVTVTLVTLLFFRLWQGGVYYKIIIISLLARLLIIIIDYIQPSSHNIIDVNEFLYWINEWKIITNHSGYFNMFINSNYEGKGAVGNFFQSSMYAGWLIKLSGPNDLLPLRIIQSCLSVIILAPIFSIVKLTIGKNISVYNAAIVLNWPTWLIRFSISVGRTSLSVIFILWGISCILEYINSKKPVYLIFFVVCAISTYFLRFYYLVIFLFPVGIYFWNSIFQIKNQIKKIGFAVLIITTIIFLTLRFGENIIKEILLEMLEQKATGDQIGGGSSYLENIIPTSIIQLIWYLPLHGFYFMLSPLIWDVKSAAQLANSIQSLFFIWIWASSMGYTIPKNLFSKYKSIIYGLLISSILLGAGVKNASAADRWRQPISLILIGIFLSKKQKEVAQQSKLKN